MGKSNATSNSLLTLIFNAVNWPNIADNTAVNPLSVLYLALHTADPGPGGNQSTHEVTYGGYARVAVLRAPAGWAVASQAAVLASNALFPVGLTGPQTASFFSVGQSPTGAGAILYSGPVNPALVCNNGVVPILGAGTTCSES